MVVLHAMAFVDYHVFPSNLEEGEEGRGVMMEGGGGGGGGIRSEGRGGHKGRVSEGRGGHKGRVGGKERGQSEGGGGGGGGGSKEGGSEMEKLECEEER